MNIFPCFGATHSETFIEHFKRALYKDLLPSEPLTYIIGWNLSYIPRITLYSTARYVTFKITNIQNSFSQKYNSTFTYFWKTREILIKLRIWYSQIRHYTTVRILNKFSFSGTQSNNIQDIHKRMVQFQKLTRNLFLTVHGHNVHR